MKNLLTILFLGITTLGYSQNTVNNADFENWYLHKPDYNFYAPDDWGTGAECFSNNEEEDCIFTIQRTTDAQSGQYAIAHFTQISDEKIHFKPYNNLIGVSTPAFTGRPKSVSFYYKYSTDENLKMQITFYMYKDGLQFAVGEARHTFTNSVSDYTRVDLNFSYFTSEAPTNILIAFDYLTTPATADDTLKVDNITFNYVTEIEDANINIIPQITVNDMVITSSSILHSPQVIDATGNIVIACNDTKEVNISHLKSGLYILRSFVNGRSVIRRILIE